MDNQININNNLGKITIDHAEINLKDANGIFAQLEGLQKMQLDRLWQEMKNHQEDYLRFFKEELRRVAIQKNIINGSRITVGGNMHIGDIYPNTKATPSLPHQLTTKVPYIKPDKIIGRSKDLDKLRALLLEHGEVVVLNGMGGIGKTTVAQAYIGKYQADYAHIIWLNYGEQTDFRAALVNATGLLTNLKININDTNIDRIFEETMAAIGRISERPNLWIIDNADADLHRYHGSLPKPPNWHVLATSREQIHRFKPMPLDFLDADDALALFRHHCKRVKDEAAIRSILKTIDYHTLTIEILAKTAQRNRTDLARLQSAISDDLKAGVYIQHKSDKIERVTSYLLSIFDSSAFGTPEYAPHRQLLQHLALIPSAYHNYEWLQQLMQAEAATWLEELSPTLDDLVQKGWLLHNTDTDQYKMHPIIQTIILRQLPPKVADILPLIDNVTKLLHLDQTKDNPVDKFEYIPYGQLLTDYFEAATESEISRLQNNLALVLKELGDYKGAKELLEKAVQSDEQNFGQDHPNTAIRYSNLALVLQDLGDYKGAKEFLEKAVQSNEQNFGQDHPNTAIRYSNLALVLKDLGDYKGAKEFLEKAVQSDEQNFGQDHPNTANRYSNLATVLKDLGDYKGAKELLEKAVQSDEQNFGQDHPNTAIRYSNLATVLKDLGDYKGAKELLEKAVQSAEQNFGQDHPNTAIRYSNLATVLQDLGDYKGAKELLEKAVQSDEQNFGQDHPNTAIRYSNLATVLKDLGDYKGAKELLEKTMKIMVNNFGETHPYTAQTYSNLATVLKDLGDYKGAKEFLEKAVQSDEQNFGQDHPNTANRYSNLALVLKDLQEYERAIQLSARAVRILDALLGEAHPNTKTIHGNFNGIHTEMLNNGYTAEDVLAIINKDHQ